MSNERTHRKFAGYWAGFLSCLALWLATLAFMTWALWPFLSQ